MKLTADEEKLWANAVPRTSREAEWMAERLAGLARSPGAVVDWSDTRALRAAVLGMVSVQRRLEAAERATRAEDDTQRLGPR